MLNKIFKSRLSKLSSKKQDDQVILEFILSHTSSDNIQIFLSTLDSAFNLSLQHPFSSDTINWKKMYFDIHINQLTINFDALNMKADLTGINVTRKSTKQMDIFKYDLVFHKQHDPEIDSTFAITYLNRKEQDPDADKEGKKVFLEYDTLIHHL